MTELGYDVVVVGGGTAGAVVASRLAEAGASVCLIEEGPSDISVPSVSDIRNWLANLGSPIDRSLRMEEPYAHQSYSAGNVLGGSSSLNNAWAFETPDFDLGRWVAGGLSPESALALADARLRVREAMDPAVVADPHPASRAFLHAALQRGLPLTQPGQVGLSDGAGWVRLTARGTARRSAATAYLHRDAASGPIVMLETRVDRVLMSEVGRVEGVLTDEGTVRADQVVVCAGALSTPTMLMRSGIGAADDLHGLGIRVRVDQPHVGRHLQDHPLTGVTWRAQRMEPTTASHGWEVAAFASGAAAGDDHAYCLLFSTMASPFGIPVDSPALSGGGYTLAAYLCRPRSEGAVRARSAAPGVAPVITAPLLTDPEGFDRAALVEAIGLLRDIASMPALAPWLDAEVDPGLAVSDERLAAFVGGRLGTMFHPSSTCRMGSDPSESVVAEDFAVWGIDGLRVCDASVLPSVPTVPPYLTCLTFAERCAEIIVHEART